ncbi:hypothetical protein GCM10009610_36970 [Pseudonocardia xinjiangensis]
MPPFGPRPRRQHGDARLPQEMDQSHPIDGAQREHIRSNHATLPRIVWTAPETCRDRYPAVRTPIGCDRCETSPIRSAGLLISTVGVDVVLHTRISESGASQILESVLQQIGPKTILGAEPAPVAPVDRTDHRLSRQNRRIVPRTTPSA